MSTNQPESPTALPRTPCSACGGCGFTEDFETMSLSGVCGWCNGTGKQPRLIAQCKCPRAIREYGQDGCTEPDYIIHRGCPECGMPWSKFLPQNACLSHGDGSATPLHKKS